MNDHRATLGAITSWFGAGIAILSQHWIGIIGVCLSAIATWYAVKASNASREANEVLKAKLEVELCAECSEGRPPIKCPLGMRTIQCPHQTEKP
jgi:hypothetical protein